MAFPQERSEGRGRQEQVSGPLETGRPAAPGSGPGGPYGAAGARTACRGRAEPGHPALTRKEKEILGECSGKPRCAEGRVLKWGSGFPSSLASRICARPRSSPAWVSLQPLGSTWKELGDEGPGRQVPRRTGPPMPGAGRPARGGPGLETRPARGEAGEANQRCVFRDTRHVHTELH